jgi:hypothetical protein
MFGHLDVDVAEMRLSILVGVQVVNAHVRSSPQFRTSLSLQNAARGKTACGP